MKILLVGNYLPDKQESMLRFNNLLIEELKKYDHEVTLIHPPVIFNRSHASFEEKGKWWGYLDKFVVFPIILRWQICKADIVHICDHSNAFYIHFVRSRPHIINCHDMIAIRTALDPNNQTLKRSGKILQNIILRGLKKTEKFACISQNSRKELLKFTNVSENKASVIYMGINYPFRKINDDEAKERVIGINEKLAFPFFLHVGGNQHYKNRIGVLRIYREFLDLAESPLPNLVLAGKPLSDEMRAYVAANNLGDHVTEIQNCSNEEMCALYSAAKIFLFPSLAEGFGWPVIEAQACGCPVLTSNFAPLTEVGGDAAAYCDPENEIEAAHQLNQLLNENKIERKKRVEAGLKNVQRFTPKIMIESYLNLYLLAINEHDLK